MKQCDVDEVLPSARLLRHAPGSNTATLDAVRESYGELECKGSDPGADRIARLLPRPTRASVPSTNASTAGCLDGLEHLGTRDEVWLARAVRNLSPAGWPSGQVDKCEAMFGGRKRRSERRALPN